MTRRQRLALIALPSVVLTTLMLVVVALSGSAQAHTCPPRHVAVHHTHYVWRFSLQLLDVVRHDHCISIWNGGRVA